MAESVKRLEAIRLTNIPNFWDGEEEEILQVFQKMEADQLLHLIKEPNAPDYGKFKITSGLDTDDLFIFTGFRETLDRCDIQWNVLNKAFGILPSHCAHNCWKVVLKCENVLQLFRAYNHMMETSTYGKVGVDLREYTDNFYNCFLYAPTHEAARDLWKSMLNLVAIFGWNDDTIMDRLIVKRGCTEFENQLPSDQWPDVVQTEKERKVLDLLSPGDFYNFQPPWSIKRKMRRWCMQANMIGDKSFHSDMIASITGPINQTVYSITYHHEDWI